MNNKLLNDETRQARREQKLRKKRERIPKHGKNLADVDGIKSQSTRILPCARRVHLIQVTDGDREWHGERGRVSAP